MADGLRRRGRVALVVLVLGVLGFLGAIVALHVTLRAESRLPADASAMFPPDAPVKPGEVFAGTVVEIMSHELDSATGWRPNDFVLWGPRFGPDNKANRQRGIILAVRESVRVFKDHLTKVSSTEFDPALVRADTAFRNDAERLWFPSAESRFRSGIAELKTYIAGLKAPSPTSKPITGRNVELIRLVQTWGDLLGDAHGSLLKDQESDGRPVSAWDTDDYFYRAQGVAHVIHHLLLAVRREYQGDFGGRQTLGELVDGAAAMLGRAAVLKPLVVVDGSPESMLANHRHNLDVLIVDARQKLYSVREELEK